MAFTFNFYLILGESHVNGRNYADTAYGSQITQQLKNLEGSNALALCLLALVCPPNPIPSSHSFSLKVAYLHFK